MQKQMCREESDLGRQFRERELEINAFPGLTRRPPHINIRGSMNKYWGKELISTA